MTKALDLFAGAGGWDIAAERLGWTSDGVEIMSEARATRDAAGLSTVASDVAKVRLNRDEASEYDVLIASPPCQTFSMSGNGSGRRDLEHVLKGVKMYATGADFAAQEWLLSFGDPRTALVLEPLRIALETMPRFIAWEQVPTVLPVWNACADVLRERGYSVATGILNAEQYGVPQTRRRAILMARRDGGTARLPIPTHSRFHVRTPDRLDDGVKPWVSMAEALGWSDDFEAVSNYGSGGDPKNRGVRDGGEPFATITSKADRFVLRAAKSMGKGMVERYGDRPGREIDEPSFTVRASAGGTEPGGFKWTLRNGNQDHACVREIDEPAGTLFFGKRANWVAFDDGQTTRKITVAEAACLQTFPAGFPFQGGKGAQMLQVGNAIPPLLAEAILRELTT